MKLGAIFVFIFTLSSFGFGQFDMENTTRSLKDIQIYPNETTDILFLKNGEILDTYRIIDMNGKVVQQGYGNSQIITILDLDSGFYLIELTKDKEIRSFKIRKR